MLPRSGWIWAGVFAVGFFAWSEGRDARAGGICNSSGICDPSENSCTCPSDCPDDPNSCSSCECGGSGGNCSCSEPCGDEGLCCSNVTASCGISQSPVCGNFWCGALEDYESCQNDCPGGACCADGSCTEVDRRDCFDFAQTYQGDYTNCQSNPCVGACCLTTGSCADNNQLSDCESQSGNFAGVGTICSAYECPQPGACCLASGACTDNAPGAGCSGIFYANDLCSDVCSPTGACCNNSSCSIQSSSSCNSGGGNYLGDGTSCAAFNCGRGACCVPFSGCIDDADQQACDAEFDSTFLGNAIACDSDANTNCRSGACCMQGVCGDSSSGGLHPTRSSCESAGGAYAGDGTACANTTCSGGCCVPSQGCMYNSNQQQCDSVSGTYLGNGITCDLAANTICPVGACCIQGTCDFGTAPFEHIQSSCAAAGGSYLGDGTICETNTNCYGACCVPFSGCIIDSNQQACDLEFDGTYLGNGTTCDSPDNTTCPIGACCIQGVCGDGGVGINPTQTSCESAGGSYLGDGTSCATISHCFGACCAPRGCITDSNQQDCEAEGGTYLGNESTCDSPTNTTCPIGACCFQGVCQDPFDVNHTQSSCEAAGGSFLGDGTICDTNTNCYGACCVPFSGCIIDSNQQACDAEIDGTYLGNGSTCDSPDNTICSNGACCLFAGGCQANTTIDDCQAGSGVFLGYGSNCPSTPCEPRGACCIDNECTNLRETTACLGQNGDFFEGAFCDDISCPLVGGACCTASGCEDRVSNGACASSQGIFHDGRLVLRYRM